MPDPDSTFTASLLIECPADGDQSGTWGDTANNDFAMFDQAIAGRVVTSCAGVNAVTLTMTPGVLSAARNRYWVFNGLPTSAVTVTVSPATVSFWVFVRNLLDGGFDLHVTQGSGASYSVGNGQSAILYCDGQGSTASVTGISDGLQLTGVGTSVLLPPGTIQAPAIAFRNSPTTGLYSPGAGTMTFVAANGPRLSINASQTTVLNLLLAQGNVQMSGTLLVAGNSTLSSVKALGDLTAYTLGCALTNTPLYFKTPAVELCNLTVPASLQVAQAALVLFDDRLSISFVDKQSFQREAVLLNWGASGGGGGSQPGGVQYSNTVFAGPPISGTQDVAAFRALAVADMPVTISPELDEVPSGALDGVNKAFTLSVAPDSSLKLFKNGLLQAPGKDYTFSGSNITYTTAPVVGAWHTASFHAATRSAVNYSSQIANDQWDAPNVAALNEGHPHGVPPDFGFYTSAYISMGNAPQGNTAMDVWGGLYVGQGGNSTTNTRINIRRLQIWWKRLSTGAWTQGCQVDNPEVGSYAEDFSNYYGLLATRTEPDGTISFLPDAPGRMCHFYAPFPRVPIDPNDVGGVVASVEARLILTNPSGTDDRNQANFVLNCGGDYYPDTTGGGIANNPGIAGGKFKYLATNWRSSSMTTLSLDDLTNNPPPIDLSGASS
jgi:hypothetical protein